MSSKPLIIVGDGIFAELALEYFSYDSPYKVKAFAVEKKFRSRSHFHDLPVVDIEDIEETYSPCDYVFHAAITFTQLNRVRARLIDIMLSKGFEPVSYISSTVKIWPSTSLGRHCFIFENNVIQPYVTIGDNCVLWSGNHIGHHSIIGNSCFVSSQVVLAGFSNIGDKCFLGVNSTVADNIKIGADCFIGAGTVVNKNLPDNTVTQPPAGKKIPGAKFLMEVNE